MSECQHQWEMTNVEFGFIAFEKCAHCNTLQTYFYTGDSPAIGDEYREGDCVWSRVENAQSIRFDLRCVQCNHVEKFHDLMGLLYCTSCMSDCEVEIQRKKYEAEKTWVLVAFGFFPKTENEPIEQRRLDMLTEYFNQKRDTSRSRIKILSSGLIAKFALCKGEFMHDVGMLSPEPPTERKPLF